MSEYKILGSKNISMDSSRFEELYTCPSGKQTIVSFLTVNNLTPDVLSYSVAVVKAGEEFSESSIVHSHLPLTEFDSFLIDKGMTLSEGDKIYVSANTFTPKGTHLAFTDGSGDYSFKGIKLNGRIYLFKLENNVLKYIIIDIDSEAKTLDVSSIVKFEENVESFDIDGEYCLINYTDSTTKVRNFLQNTKTTHGENEVADSSTQLVKRESRMIKMGENKYVYILNSFNGSSNNVFLYAIETDYPRIKKWKKIEVKSGIKECSGDKVDEEHVIIFTSNDSVDIFVKIYKIDWETLEFSLVYSDTYTASIDAEHISYRTLKYYNGTEEGKGILRFEKYLVPVKLTSYGITEWGSETDTGGASVSNVTERLDDNYFITFSYAPAECVVGKVEDSLSLSIGSWTTFFSADILNLSVDYRDANNSLALGLRKNSSYKEMYFKVGTVNKTEMSVTFNDEYYYGNNSSKVFFLRPRIVSDDAVLVYTGSTLSLFSVSEDFTTISYEYSLMTSKQAYYYVSNDDIEYYDMLVDGHNILFSSPYTQNHLISFNTGYIDLENISLSVEDNYIVNLVPDVCCAYRKRATFKKVYREEGNPLVLVVYYNETDTVLEYSLLEYNEENGKVFVKRTGSLDINSDEPEIEFYDTNKFALYYSDSSGEYLKRYLISAEGNITSIDDTPLTVSTLSECELPRMFRVENNKLLLIRKSGSVWKASILTIESDSSVVFGPLKDIAVSNILSVGDIVLYGNKFYCLYGGVIKIYNVEGNIIHEQNTVGLGLSSSHYRTAFVEKDKIYIVSDDDFIVFDCNSESVLSTEEDVFPSYNNFISIVRKGMLYVFYPDEDNTTVLVGKYFINEDNSIELNEIKELRSITTNPGWYAGRMKDKFVWINENIILTKMYHLEESDTFNSHIRGLNVQLVHLSDDSEVTDGEKEKITYYDGDIFERRIYTSFIDASGKINIEKYKLNTKTWKIELKYSFSFPEEGNVVNYDVKKFNESKLLLGYVTDSINLIMTNDTGSEITSESTYTLTETPSSNAVVVGVIEGYPTVFFINERELKYSVFTYVSSFVLEKTGALEHFVEDIRLFQDNFLVSVVLNDTISFLSVKEDYSLTKMENDVVLLYGSYCYFEKEINAVIYADNIEIKYFVFEEGNPLSVNFHLYGVEL